MNGANLVKSLCFYFLIFFYSCGQDGSTKNLSERNLLEYGVPITIRAHDSAEIRMIDWGVQKDISIVDTLGYNMQIFSSKASHHQMDKAISELRSSVTEGVYFSRMTHEDPDGFIFEMKIDSLISYDFRHLKIQGDREYLFQAGLSGSFTEEQINYLYDIAKDAK